VRLHFEGTVAYQNGFAANVSATGMYVKHPDPPPLGTRLVFELVLGEERKPVQGAGVVAWSREKYEGPGRPAGVGIQFTEIDALSRQHIAEALFAYLENQLGDELAEDPDVAELVATSTSRAPLEMLESMGRSVEQEAAATRATPPKGTPAPPLPERELPTSFRLFEEPAPAPRSEEPSPPDGLFTPAIPPDEPLELRRSGARRARSPWPALAVGALVAVGGFAAWWYLAGPGSIGEPSPVVVAPARSAPAAEPPAASAPRPTLDPEPGTAATLAQTVGAQATAAPEPMPVDTTRAGQPAASAPGAAPEPSVGAAEPTPIDIRLANAPPPAATTRASRVVAIDWEESNGLTVVVISGDAAFPAGSYKWNEIRDANPRVLVRFNQMGAGFGKPVLAAGTPELRQVRTGYHERASGNEQHVVLDLAAPDIKVESVESSGNRLYIRLVKP
jgi:uncharacterized protein (TIGR02266 family)